MFILILHSYLIESNNNVQTPLLNKLHYIHNIPLTFVYQNFILVVQRVKQKLLSIPQIYHHIVESNTGALQLKCKFKSFKIFNTLTLTSNV